MGVVNTPIFGIPAPDGADPIRNGDNRMREMAQATDDALATCLHLVGFSRVTGGGIPAMLGSTFRNIQDGADTPLMVENIDVESGDLLHVMVMCEVQNEDASTDAVLAIEMQPHASFAWGQMAFGVIPPVASMDGDTILTTGDQVDPFANPPVGAKPGWWINPMLGTGAIDLRVSFATTDSADIVNVDSFLWVGRMRATTLPS